MKKQLLFAGAVVAGIVLSAAAINAQRPGGLGPRGGAGIGQGLGPGQGQVVGRGGFRGGPGGPGFGRMGGRGPMMLGGLDLTDDQKAKVKTLFESEREANQDGAKALNDARQALRDAIFANAVDGGAIANLTAKVAAAEKAQLERHVQTQQALAGILTPEQRAKLAERGGRGPGRGGFGGGFRGGR